MNAMLMIPKITPDDLLKMGDEGKGYELIEGELRELHMSYLSSFVAGEIHWLLKSYVKLRQLGWVAPEGTSFRCFPDDPSKVRRADTSFHRMSRLTAAMATSEGHCSVVPDLVVEVVSPNDLADEVNAKRIDWLDAGAELVWIVQPVQQTVHPYLADGTVKLFRRTDTLTGGPVLPEFCVLVSELFLLPTK